MNKSCRKCGVVKDLGDFHAHPQMRDGHVNMCKACQGAYEKVQRKKRDPDGSKERDRLSAFRAANPERWKEYQRRAEEKARANGSNAKRSATRNARLAAARQGNIVSLQAILTTHGMVCSICTKAIEHKVQLTFDHVIPIARGGAHTDENLRPAHKSCNSWKGDRLPEEIAGLTPPEPGAVDLEWEERRRAKVAALRSANSRRWWETATPEQKAARSSKIAAAKKGRPNPLYVTPKKRGPQSPEWVAKRTEAIQAAYAKRTPEERAAWSARCREIKSRAGFRPSLRINLLGAA